jgi:hypothetical protein
MKMITAACGLQDQYTQHNIPTNTIFQDDPNGPACEHQWNYHSIIYMFTYLNTSTNPDMMFTFHLHFISVFLQNEFINLFFSRLLGI